MSPLNIAVTDPPDGIWIQVGGEVDVSNHAQLQAALSAVDYHRADVVHLDLHRLAFCDVGGGRLLLQFEHAARLSGHETRIHGPTPLVRMVLTLLDADERLIGG